MSTLLEAWTSPGKVATAFASDFTSNVKGIMGPVGGGKTVTCIFASQALAASQPTCRDGVVRSKGIVIRDSFRTLEKTVLSSWFQWFPKDHPGWTYSGGNDRPATHTLRFRMPDGRTTESITEFVGIGDKRVEDLLRGWEGTWAWLNEGDLVSPDVLDYVTQRIPRYPSKSLLPEGVDPIGQTMIDFNAPDIDNYLYQKFVKEPVPNWRLYIQPGAFDRDRETGESIAENTKNLPTGYYERIMAGKAEWWVRRFVHNRWGYSRFGTPVYPEFNDTLHVADRALDPLPGVPIGIGMDAGMSPAAVIGQHLPDGQVRIIDEFVPGHGVGPSRFAEGLVRLLHERYPRHEIGTLVGDPAAMHGADTEAGEMSWLEIVGKALGRAVMPCFTNEPSLRTDGVRQCLTRLIDGRKPGLIVSPTCTWLVQGFAYGYRFENQRKDVNAPFKDRPEKNQWSHPHDALQYLILEMLGRMGIIEHAARAGRPGRFEPVAPAQQQAPGSFDVWSV